MEISQSNFNITDLNYGLVEGAKANVRQNTSEQALVTSFALNTSPIQAGLRLKKKNKRSSKRLNSYDNEYLNDFDFQPETDSEEENPNFFIPQKPKFLKKNFLKSIKKIVEKIPVLNSYLLTQKSQRLKNTVKDLNEINQNVDDIVSGVSSFGEDDSKYGSIAKNLVQASNIIAKVKDDIA